MNEVFYGIDFDGLVKQQLNWTIGSCHKFCLVSANRRVGTAHLTTPQN